MDQGTMTEQNDNLSNYDKVIETWRKKFLEMDQEALIRKFQLEADEKALYLTYFSHKMRLDRKTGKVTMCEQPERELTFNTVITIYNLFHYAIENPAASGKLVPFREVKRVYPFEAAYRKTILSEFQNTFSGHVEELITACPLCLYNLNTSTSANKLPVHYFTELLAEALGLKEEVQE